MKAVSYNTLEERRYEEDGELHLRGCPNDPGHALWLMEMAKKKLLGGF